MTIDKKYIDVDLSDPPQEQAAGWIEQSNDELLAATADVPYFADEFPERMVPRSQWKERAQRLAAMFRGTTTKIYSQGNEGSCVGFSITQALETTLRRHYGLTHWVSLSGMSLYKRIGRTPGSGAYIPDGISEIVERGCLPVDSAENKAKYQHTHPRTGFSRSLPSGWEQTAAMFRVAKWAKCGGADEVASALLNGFCGVVGRSRHAIPYVYLEEDDGRFYAAYANSWTPQWGDEGFGYDSERTFGSLTFYVLLDVVTRPDLEPPGA